MYKLKTQITEVKVKDFLNNITDAQKRDDSMVIVDLMSTLSKEEPKMWGPSIVGFGKYHYKYESGHEGDMCILGFSPRKAALVIYFTGGFTQKYPELLAKLGKYKASKGCLYIKRLTDIDVDVLKQMLQKSIDDTQNV